MQASRLGSVALILSHPDSIVVRVPQRKVRCRFTVFFETASLSNLDGPVILFCPRKQIVAFRMEMAAYPT